MRLYSTKYIWSNYTHYKRHTGLSYCGKNHSQIKGWLFHSFRCLSKFKGDMICISIRMSNLKANVWLCLETGMTTHNLSPENWKNVRTLENTSEFSPSLFPSLRSFSYFFAAEQIIPLAFICPEKQSATWSKCLSYKLHWQSQRFHNVLVPRWVLRSTQINSRRWFCWTEHWRIWEKKMFN